MGRSYHSLCIHRLFCCIHSLAMHANYAWDVQKDCHIFCLLERWVCDFKKMMFMFCFFNSQGLRQAQMIHHWSKKYWQYSSFPLHVLICMPPDLDVWRSIKLAPILLGNNWPFICTLHTFSSSINLITAGISSPLASIYCTTSISSRSFGSHTKEAKEHNFGHIDVY